MRDPDGYENAPATRMLATHCGACGRPLVDAKSVEVGMGPDCRAKYGYGADVPEGVRQEANAIVYQIALRQSEPSLELCQLAARIKEIGLPKLAARVLERICRVRIEVLARGVGWVLSLAAPYSPAFVEDSRRISGRHWRKETKTTEFRIDQRAQLNAALQRHFRGALAMGPKGPFVIGGTAGRP